jgi:hypothetical protein
MRAYCSINSEPQRGSCPKTSGETHLMHCGACRPRWSEQSRDTAVHSAPSVRIEVVAHAHGTLARLGRMSDRIAPGVAGEILQFLRCVADTVGHHVPAIFIPNRDITNNPKSATSGSNGGNLLGMKTNKNCLDTGSNEASDVCLRTRRSEVRILPGAPFLIGCLPDRVLTGHIGNT